ncbi:MAG: hypothetical protein HKN31_00330, partial [Pricia sp.]|nr:hypothetical protein [Pricia sp.]
MKKVSLAVLAATIFATSCSDETTIYNREEDSLTLENGDQTLLKSVVYDKAGVLDIVETGQITGKSAKNAA